MNQNLKIIDGKEVAKNIRLELADKIKQILPTSKRKPGLGVILIGDNPASKTYVANKENAAKEAGFETFNIHLSNDATFEQAKEAILSFNNNPNVDGILLQLPLPKHLDADALLNLIDPTKDADGLHPTNQGLLMQGQAVVKPCTPAGCIELIESINYDLTGKNAVVIGRSILVGKPAALLLLEKNATVTIAHSKSQDIKAIVKNADVVIAAVGIANFVKGDWIKKGAVVIDVGINRMPDGKLCGDVEFESAKQNASAITPVPGGVGPMTIAMLLKNTWGRFLKNNNDFR